MQLGLELTAMCLKSYLVLTTGVLNFFINENTKITSKNTDQHLNPTLLDLFLCIGISLVFVLILSVQIVPNVASPNLNNSSVITCVIDVIYKKV